MKTPSREEIMKLNQVFAWHMMQLQKDRYAPEHEYEEGEEVVFDFDEEAVILSKEHAQQLNEEERREFEENRDVVAGLPEIESVGFAIYAAPGDEARAYIDGLSGGLVKLSVSLGLGDLMVMGQWNIPWLSQQNDYPPAAAAHEFIKGFASSDFSGGFLVESENIPEFIPHLFWLIRCNASLPYFLLGFEKSRTVFEICKFGMLHVIYYEEDEKIQVKILLEAMGFEEVPTCFDPVDFGGFEGRRLDL